MFDVKSKLLYNYLLIEENIFKKREKNKKYSRDVVSFNEPFL